MTITTLEQGLRNLIDIKLDKDYECEINDSTIKEKFFIKSYDGGLTYNLYRGCDLEIGDVSLDNIVRSLCRLHNELTGSIIKNYYIGKWGGCTDLYVVNNLSILPQGVRYIGSEKNMDIYESEEGIVYGVRC